MDLFFSIVKFRFARFFAYPVEIFSAVLIRLIAVITITVIWSIVVGEKESASELLAYFLLADGVSSISMSYSTRFGKFLRHGVRDGWFSTYLIQPVNELLYAYSSTIGVNGVELIISGIFVGVGIILVSPSIFGLIAFFIFMIFAVLTGFGLNLFEGIMSLHMTEATGVKNAIRHVSRVFSGKVAPLSYFPGSLQTIAKILPFQIMTYAPVSALEYSGPSSLFWSQLTLGIFWSGVLLILTITAWKYSLRKYEAVGS